MTHFPPARSDRLQTFCSEQSYSVCVLSKDTRALTHLKRTSTSEMWHWDTCGRGHRCWCGVKHSCSAPREECAVSSSSSGQLWHQLWHQQRDHVTHGELRAAPKAERREKLPSHKRRKPQTEPGPPASAWKTPEDYPKRSLMCILILKLHSSLFICSQSLLVEIISPKLIQKAKDIMTDLA